MLAVIVLIAAGIRLIFEMLEPVLPEIAVVVAAAALWQLWRWHRERW